MNDNKCCNDKHFDCIDCPNLCDQSKNNFADTFMKFSVGILALVLTIEMLIAFFQ